MSAADMSEGVTPLVCGDASCVKCTAGDVRSTAILRVHGAFLGSLKGAPSCAYVKHPLHDGTSHSYLCDSMVDVVEVGLLETQACVDNFNALKAQVDTPEVLDFSRAVQMEAAHQRVRWGTDHDAGKTDADWYWLLAHIAGKALHGVGGGDNSPEKQLHRIATIAAVAANWHLYRLGKTNMRPGIQPPADEGGSQ